MDEELRCTPIYSALYRPHLILGGERELVLLVSLFAGVLIVVAMNIISAIIGGFIWFVCIYVLRRMAKIDPMLSKVYIRQLRYQRYYPPYSRPFRVARRKWPY
uniref:Conjugal transfer protein TrbD n=1 Tax=Bartonella schoenbuchensis TaxID=165694 RepID=A0A024LQL6_9HYPH|nr:conjugal transfer protein TrbD [Bartonella schoenbuchensis]